MEVWASYANRASADEGDSRVWSTSPSDSHGRGSAWAPSVAMRWSVFPLKSSDWITVWSAVPSWMSPEVCPMSPVSV